MFLSRYFSFAAGVAILMLVLFALVLPNRISDLSASSVLYFPVEILLLGALLLLPGRAGLVARWIVASLLALGVILKCADMATFNVFARPFNPVFDGYLFANGMHLLNNTIGKVAAWVVAALLTLFVVAIIIVAFWLLGRVQTLLRGHWPTSILLLAGGGVLWLVLFLVDSSVASARFYWHLSAHARAIVVAVADIKLFNKELDKTDLFVGDKKDLFTELRDKNVLVIFVESYGRTVLDNPEFAPHIRPLLERSTRQLAEQGFATRSGFLTSPTVGGLSWLAHGTAMSGLWIDNEIRYKSLMVSQRPTLNRLFKQAGWRTVAVMPAITMAWPEGQYYGYDHIYHAYNLGYEGKPFNWVTMPDQYTLAAFHQRELAKKADTPVMAEIALISSHAPWTPVPRLIDWNDVGDGAVFNIQAASGDSPEEVWKDNARIRLQFRLSIQYALENLVSYLANYGDDNLVVLVLGDHQPAPLVTGETSNRDVPVHLIARDPKVMELVSDWLWTESLLPSGDAPVWRMSEIFERFTSAFSGPATALSPKPDQEPLNSD